MGSITQPITRIPSGGLRITALEIRNLWGVSEAIIKPGSRNIIRGANGTGKTSLLKAIELALGGGSLGQYKRLGAEGEPELVLEISGPSDSIRIEREGDKPPKVLRRGGQSAAYEKVPAPATFLRGLFDTKGANPFTFLGASDNDRAQLLLEALDLEMDEGRLAATLGDDADLAASIPSNLHPLIRLALTHDAIYSARRGCNVERDAKHKAAEQLKRSVPAERTPDLSGEIDTLEGKVLNDSEIIAREVEANDGELRNAKGKLEDASEIEIYTLKNTQDAESDKAGGEFNRRAAEIRAEADKQIMKLELAAYAERESKKTELLTVIKGIQSKLKENISTVTARREKLRSIEDGEKALIAKDREQLAKLREQHAESDRHENTRSQIDEFEKAAGAHHADSLRLTDVLKGLEALKRQLAEKLPIAGLDISGREIKVNGVAWKDLNKAAQGGIAAVVAVERAKKSKLPVVFFDQAEQFDEAHIDAISRVVEQAKCQLFAAVVVRQGEITVEADGQSAGTVRIDAPVDPLVHRAKD